MFYKKGALKNFVIFTEKTPVLGFFNKDAGLQALPKRDSNTGVFPREYCEIFKSNYFEEHLRMTASVLTVSTIKLSHKCLTGSKYVSSLVRLLFPSLSPLLTTHPQS